MHEALHGNLFRNPFFDRWVGFVLAVPTLFSCSAYKVAHMNHHRYTRTERDQDEFSYSCRTHGQYVALFYASFLVGSLLYMILALNERRQPVINTAASLAGVSDGATAIMRCWERGSLGVAAGCKRGLP
jgi:fatty acid desaturase